MKKIVKTLCPRVLIPAAKKTHGLARSWSGRRRVSKLLQSGRPIQVEMGSGGKKGAGGWTTLDVASGCDVYCDLARGIAFPNESVQALYSSHFFEHLTFHQAQRLLDECLRVLVPGGTFSICVPDAHMYLKAYVEAESLPAQAFGYKHAYNHTTRMDYVNYIAYMDGVHKYMFDQENLLAILKNKGFRNVRTRAFEQPLDMKEREYGSLFAIAQK